MQKLHSFFMPGNKMPSSSSSPAAATQHGADRKEQDSIAEGEPATSGGVQQEVPPSAEGSGQDRHRESKRPRLLEDATNTLAAAAREKLLLEAHSGAQSLLKCQGCQRLVV